MATYGFHSEAADEYLAATRYYLDHASTLVAAAFVAEVEDAIEKLLDSPTTWPVIEEHQIRYVRSYWDRGRPRPHALEITNLFFTKRLLAQQAGEGARRSQ